MGSNATSISANATTLATEEIVGEENGLLNDIRTESWDDSEQFIKSVKVNGVECTGWRDNCISYYFG